MVPSLLVALLTLAEPPEDAVSRALKLLREGAVEDARAALAEAEPGWRTSLLSARIEKASGRPDEALRCLDAVAEPAGSTAALLRDIDRGRVASRLGRAGDALRIADALARAYPEDPWVRASASETSAGAALIGKSAPEPCELFQVDVGMAFASAAGWARSGEENPRKAWLRGWPVRTVIEPAARGPGRDPGPGRRAAALAIVRRRDLEPGGAVPGWIVPWARQHGADTLGILILVELEEGGTPGNPFVEGIDPEGRTVFLWTRSASARRLYGAERLPWVGFFDRRARLTGWKSADETPAEGEGELGRAIGGGAR
ncbi:MAG: hypothetical protein JXP34_11010 [Planctomycetes bacterium]|nr:hypothetical protein [Planctomycetota bacterium]